MSSANTHIWLVEDHSDLRESLAELLETEGACKVRSFGTCEDGLAALESEITLGADNLPGVMILDLGLPGMSGIEGIRAFKELHPDMRILVFTMYDDRKKVFEAICAGASGYLLKLEPPERIVAAVGELERGGWPMTPEIAGNVLERFSRLGPQKSDIELSGREKEVLQLIVDGLARKEIAWKLDISQHTVDSYVRRIYDKLHVKTLGGAVAKALREGLV